MPEFAELPERLGGVLAVLVFVVNEGYLATGDGVPMTGVVVTTRRVACT